MTSQPTAQTLKDLTAAFNRHDIDAIMTFFADDAVFDAPRGPNPWGSRYEGRHSVADALAIRWRDIPDVHYSDDEHFMAANRGASEWTMSGTNVSGEPVNVRGCDLWTFRDGLIVRKNSFWKRQG
jgi:ketosteroid isomerase-like protein